MERCDGALSVAVQYVQPLRIGFRHEREDRFPHRQRVAVEKAAARAGPALAERGRARRAFPVALPKRRPALGGEEDAGSAGRDDVAKPVVFRRPRVRHHARARRRAIARPEPRAFNPGARTAGEEEQAVPGSRQVARVSVYLGNHKGPVRRAVRAPEGDAGQLGIVPKEVQGFIQRDAAAPGIAGKEPCGLFAFDGVEASSLIRPGGDQRAVPPQFLR